MGRGPREHGDTPLDERHQAVLLAIVRRHIQSGEPVGSTTVSRSARIELSPASIRALMAELEERGMLAQPHTSAGRIPTDKAFRYYVDHLMGRPRVPRGLARAIESALAATGGELAETLGEASRQLSRRSQQLGIVVAPELQRLIFDHLEFVRIDERRVLAILLDRAGVVHDRVLRVSESFEPRELEHMGRYISEEFGGRSLPEMRRLVEQRLAEERAVYDRLMARSLELGRQALGEMDEVEAQWFVEGTSNLLALPEFADLDLLRVMFRTLEQKRRMIELLGQVLAGEGVRIVIGQENPLSELARCSLVVSAYGPEGRRVGTVGIVGPTRMPYGRAVALVEHLARVLTEMLTQPGN